MGMGMKHWEWEGMGLRKTFRVGSSGGLAHRETGRFPGGPLLQEFFRAPGRTCEFISLIISRHSRQTGSAVTEPEPVETGGQLIVNGRFAFLALLRGLGRRTMFILGSKSTSY